ncbi:hypothetical protein [Rhizobium laguerreae]|uniref:hypothetical protein n=1 Tax=Rhizobium laguerreae TaxID=1076926 RepID=UPI001C8FB09E|nr:hypothetical protein [Rhizobium laguerreae]MBY3119945.1 hypothetical protein [Rhizobium laguerreae]
MTSQLDFHDLMSATVLAFPPRRLTRWVEAAAERVHDAGPDARQALLNEAGLLQLRYILVGIDGDKAYSLANEFEQAIIAEVHRLKWSGRRPDPRGVA